MPYEMSAEKIELVLEARHADFASAVFGFQFRVFARATSAVRFFVATAKNIHPRPPNIERESTSPFFAVFS